MNATNICVLCMIITVVSFLGFMVENTWTGITQGYMDNRSMCLPFLLGYGLAILAVYLIFGTPIAPRFFRKQILLHSRFLRFLAYFGIMFLCVSIGEIVLGTLVEKAFGIVWWNYSSLPLHITKYTSVPTSMGFALMITVFMNYCFEPLYSFFMNIDYAYLRKMTFWCMSLMIIDFFYSAFCMAKRRSLVERWRINTANTRAHRYWVAKVGAS